MTLQEEIRHKLSHSSYRDIVKMMGYHKIDNRVLERINTVCNDPHMGLYSGYYDFKYTGTEFIEALCELLAINLSDYEDDIEAIKEDYRDRRDRFKSYVFVETGFKRENQPIFMLIFMDHLRHLYLDYEVRTLPLANQVDYVKKLSRQHYKDNNGELKTWGEIKTYVFCYEKDKYIEFTPDGIVIAEMEQYNIPRAKLTCNGKDISALIKEKSDEE